MLHRCVAPDVSARALDALAVALELVVDRTTAISGHFLRLARRGEFGERLVAVVDTCCTPSGPDPEAVDRLLATGATSGADALAGVAAAAESLPHRAGQLLRGGRMSVRHRIVANMYKDSVALMAISSKILAIEGIDAASVVMATPTNLDNLVEAGLSAGLDETKPSDLIVAVAGTDDACEAALALADELLAEQPLDSGASAAELPVSSTQMAVAADPALNFALISVPGAYAAAEAIKAVRLGMSVMVFSDNVPVEQELAMKTLAAERGVMVMGPDCGTAIVNGLPLGFANVVRRGPIGVVGASGTGMQEVTARIHNLGSGVSQALGTGGHDLSDDIGGISMLHGLRSLEQDSSTTVIVLVSKPPSERVAQVVLDEARGMTTPVVVIFLGADPTTFSDDKIHGAGTLADAADLAVAIAAGVPADSVGAHRQPSRARRAGPSTTLHRG